MYNDKWIKRSVYIKKILILHWEFFHSHNPGFNSASEMSKRNASWGVKAPVRRADNLTTIHVPSVLKSRCLKLLETTAPLQAPKGIALPFYYSQRDDLNLCIT